MKIGVFIGRLNPPHKGHFRVMKEALEACDVSLLVLGSTNISDKNNPLSSQVRKNIISSVFSEDKLKIELLDDFESDLEWLSALEKIILKHTIQEDIELTIYAGDFENDSAIKVIKQYEDKLFIKPNYKEINRNQISFTYKGEKYFYSSTLVREAMIKQDKKLLRELLHPVVYEKISFFHN